jgi:hypothetical protein
MVNGLQCAVVTRFKGVFLRFYIKAVYLYTKQLKRLKKPYTALKITRAAPNNPGYMMEF